MSYRSTMDAIMNNSDLYRVLDENYLTDTCKMLSAGGTFIIPSNEVINKMVSIGDSGMSGEEKHEQLSRYVNALSLKRHLKSSSDFERGVMNGNGQLYKAAGVRNNTVTLNNNMVVRCNNGKYEMVGGEVDTSINPSGMSALNRMMSGEKVFGAGEYDASEIRGGFEYKQWRTNLWTKIANDYIVSKKNAFSGSGSGDSDPSLAYALGLLQGLSKNNPEVRLGIHPVIDYSPLITLYLLLEPYSKEHRLIDNDVLRSALSTCGNFQGDIYNLTSNKTDQEAASEYLKELESSMTDSSLVFSNPRDLFTELDHMRQNVLVASTVAELTNKLTEAYSSLTKGNKTNNKGLSPVFPQYLSSIYGKYPFLKEWQDTVRRMMSNRLFDIPPDVCNITSMVMCLKDILPGNQLPEETKAYNSSFNGNAKRLLPIDAKEFLIDNKLFVSTTECFYFLLPSSVGIVEEAPVFRPGLTFINTTYRRKRSLQFLAGQLKD